MTEIGPVLYYLLLLIWPLLLWPAWRLRGAARAGLLAVILAGAAALAYEGWAVFIWAPLNPIRLDAVLIFAVLLIAYTIAAAILVGAGWRVAGVGMFSAVVLVGAGFASIWVSGMRESERLADAVERQNALLFEARFRDRRTYERVFGPFDANASDLPTGHWVSIGDPHLTRLIVNGGGRMWLYYHCGETECFYESAQPHLRADGASNRRWQTPVTFSGMNGPAVTIEAAGGGRLRVLLGERRVAFDPAPPPAGDTEERPQYLNYLGSFVAIGCVRAHAEIRQLWLWRGDDMLYALGVFGTFVHGRRANYVVPAAMGEARREGDRWTYAWRQAGREWRAEIGFDGDTPLLDLWRDGAALDKLALTEGVIFADDGFDLAPRTNGEDWSNWFDVIFAGRSLSADIPAC